VIHSVLLVDDDPAYRALVRTALDDSVFAVVAEAADGDEALRLIDEHEPDLVLLDLAMPGRDGFSTLAELDGRPHCPMVIVLSGLPAGNLRRPLASGRSVGFMAKGSPPSRLGDELLVLAGMLGTVGTALAQRSTRLANDPASARAARQFVDATLRRWDCQNLFDTAALLVTELVGNAVRHADSECEVSVRLLGDVIRVDVRDASSDLPRRRQADPDETSGRGLELTEALARRWGIDVLEVGKSIWFELPLPVRGSVP
jgi:CheY-like chemotaxis protein